MNMSLSKLWEIVKDGESWHATFHGVTKSQTWLSDWTTTNNNNNNNYTNNTIGWDLQCARLWAHHVINSHNYFLRQGLVPSPFYSWRNWEPTKVINLLSLTGHVWMQELDCEESWAPKNWCFCTVVLEKTLESPMDCKEIQLLHSKGDQPWDFFGRKDAKAETPVLWPPHAKSWLIGKDSDAGRDWGQEGKGTTEDEMAGWHHRLNGHEFEWTPGDGDGQGVLVCCNSWGHKESDTTERLNWQV